MLKCLSVGAQIAQVVQAAAIIFVVVMIDCSASKDLRDHGRTNWYVINDGRRVMPWDVGEVVGTEYRFAGAKLLEQWLRSRIGDRSDPRTHSDILIIGRGNQQGYDTCEVGVMVAARELQAGSSGVVRIEWDWEIRTAYSMENRPGDRFYSIRQRRTEAAVHHDADYSRFISDLRAATHIQVEGMDEWEIWRQREVLDALGCNPW